MEIREDGEQFIHALTLSAVVAAVVALPLFVLILETGEWIHQKSLLSWDDIIASHRPVAVVAFALVAGAVTYTIVQEAIVFLGRSAPRTPTPVSPLLILAPLSVLLYFSWEYIRHWGDAQYTQFGGGAGFALPGLVLVSLLAAPWVAPPITLRYAMSRAQGARVPLVYATGLVGLGLIFWIVTRRFGNEHDLQRHTHLFLSAATGFLAGGLSQLFTTTWAQSPEPDEAPPVAPETAPDTEDYPNEAMQSWFKLWIAYNVILFVEGVIALGYVAYLTSHASHVDSRLQGGQITIAFFFAIGANIAFCLGPLVDVFIYKDTGIRMGRGRYILFALGLLSAVLFIFEGTLFVRTGGLIRF